MTSVRPPLHYLALGDSYTIGEGIPAEACWPIKLAEGLRRAGIMVDYPRIVAVTGWTTDELTQGMDQAALSVGYDLVTLQIGVNNQYRGRSLDDYGEQFSALLARAIELAGNRPGRVVVVSIPDWGVTRFAREAGSDSKRIAEELDQFNAWARTQSARSGVPFVDITAISRQHPERLANDGLHPSAAQYTLWLEVILPIARAALS